MRKRSAIVIATAAVGAFAAFGAQSAAAQAIPVTNTNDSGAGSLRTAIDKANQLSGFDRVVIDATGTIPLQSGLPTVTTPMTIQGPGASDLSLDGSTVPGAALALDPVVSCTPSTRCLVTLRGVSINHADVAIQNNAVLDVVDSGLSGNDTGIENSRRLTVTDSSLSDNFTGIAANSATNNGSRTMGVLRSTLSGNQIGISNDRGPLEVSNSTLRDNDTGIFNGWLTDTGSVEVSRSTLSGNGTGILNYPFLNLEVSQSTLRANDVGIENLVGTAVIDRSTLSGNQNSAISNLNFCFESCVGGDVHVTQSTLSGNSSGTHAAIETESAASTGLKSTIVANSSGRNCSRVPGGGIHVTSAGFNLADDGSCNLTAQGDKPNTEPNLRPLAFYGGPTKTYALRPTSPAVDAGLADNAAADQRRQPRKVDYPGVAKAVGGDNSDIGAFELQTP